MDHTIRGKNAWVVGFEKTEPLVCLEYEGEDNKQ